MREFLPAEARASAEASGPIRDPRVLREIDRAQKIIEAQNHAIRRMLRKYSLLVEYDRRCVRMLREEALRFGRLPAGVEKDCGAGWCKPVLIQAFLCVLDRFWADHLQYVDDVREGIDLERFAGRDPGLEYIRRVGGAFEQGLREVERSVVAVCARLKDDPGASLETMGIRRPSSTWTYQIDDAAPVRFNLSMIATSNIGVAALAMGPLLLFQEALVKFASWLARLLRGRPQRP